MGNMVQAAEAPLPAAFPTPPGRLWMPPGPFHPLALC